jgi:hypothetical protein
MLWNKKSYLCVGGEGRPRMPAGAPTSGGVTVASHPRRGDPSDPSAALDGPTDQPGVLPPWAELLGQVHTVGDA